MDLIVHSDVEKFIQTLQKPTQAKWILHLMLLQQYGSKLGMPHARRISSSLSELRIRGKQEVRALFTIKNHRIVIVSAFVKKTQKIPNRQLDRAQKRVETI